MRHDECDCHRGKRIGRMIGMVIAGMVTAVVLGLIFGYLVVLLWNWLMPAIFGLGKITYWQAFGLIVLAKILFGGFGHGHGHGPGGKFNHPGHSRYYRERMRQNWEDGTWNLKGGWRNWDYYDDWWKAEGKTAFEGYIERQQQEGKSKEEQE